MCQGLDQNPKGFSIFGLIGVKGWVKLLLKLPTRCVISSRSNVNKSTLSNCQFIRKMSDFSMEDAGDQFEDDLLKAMQNSLEVNTVPLPAATQPNLAYRGMYNCII